MLTSTNLAPIPFIGHCDNARLQMSAKQLAQTLTHLNCEVPKVISHDYQYLSDSTQLFHCIAQYDGRIIYENDDIMLVYYQISSDQSYIQPYETPQVKRTSSFYATQLRYRRPIGDFHVGDILFEYDCFHNNIPTYGYNLWTAYLSWFGFNHEDATVLSNHALNTLHATKTEQVLIPIYEYSTFRTLYPNSPYRFIPAVGQEISDNVIAYRNQVKTGSNIMAQLKNMSLTDLATLSNDDSIFTAVPITSRIPNAKVISIRVHLMNKLLKTKLVDKNLELFINRMIQDAEPYQKEVVDSLRMLNKSYCNQLLAKYYVMVNKLKGDMIDKNNIVYLIEMDIAKDSPTHFGDKTTNRYANKGVCSLALPDELRPTVVRSGQPIDYISGPITGVGRMNFGQFIEGCIAKAVDHSEKVIKLDSNKIPEEILKLAKISRVLKDYDYAEKIENLAHKMEFDSILRKQFMLSVNELGLYFEAPTFANFQLKDLEDQIYKDYNFRVQEDLHISKDCIEYMTERLQLTGLPPAPSDGIILPKIFCAPIYTLKLKQEAYYKSSSRDFGAYKSTNYQPLQGRGQNGFIGASAKLGQMELIIAPLYSNI